MDIGANGRIEAGEFAEFMGLTPSDPVGGADVEATDHETQAASVTGEKQSTVRSKEEALDDDAHSGQLHPVKSLKLEEGREVLHGILSAPQAGFFEVS